MPHGTFSPPGPGSWELEATHMTRPLSRWMGAVYPEPFIRGFRESMARYGMLLDYLEPAIVNGFLYTAARPVGAPRDARGTPPRLLFKLLTTLHPEIRSRLRRCRETFETKRWRQDVAAWDNEWMPAVVATNRRLGTVEPRHLAVDDLITHLEACRAAADHAFYRHHTLNACYALPVGDFLVHAAAWTGKPTADLLALLRGASPISVGALAELERLAHALRGEPDALALLAGNGPAAETVAGLRAWPGEVGAAAQAYLDLVGPRIVTGADVAELRADEVPDVLVKAMRAGLEGIAPAAPDHEALASRVREAVPSQHRQAFDDLLAEARHVHRVRDERTCLNDLWTIGIARRGLLAAGERLTGTGRLDAPDRAVDLTPDEVISLLRGGAGPDRAEVAERVRYRTTTTISQAPEVLGLPPAPPPPAEWLPPHGARASRAVTTLIREMMHVAAKRTGRTRTVSGLSASPGTYEGTARVVSSPADFNRVQQGDVLVTRSTTPTYNVLLPILGALVTDRGGLLSHAAIVAREYGLPAVVGTSDATSVIPDGARVRVLAGTGEVEVLG